MPPAPSYIATYYFLLQVNLDMPEKAQAPAEDKLGDWVENQILAVRHFQERRIGLVHANVMTRDDALAILLPPNGTEISAVQIAPPVAPPSPLSYEQLSEEEKQEAYFPVDRVAAAHATRSDADNSFRAIAERTATLVEEKNRAYGDSFVQSAKVLGIIFPDGVKPGDYENLLAVTRILDKLFRIGTGRTDSEDPARDITGYGLLMQRSAALKREGK